MRLTEAWNGSLSRTAYWPHNLEKGQPDPPNHFKSLLHLSVQDLSSGRGEEYLVELDRFDEDVNMTPAETTYCYSLGALLEELEPRGISIYDLDWTPLVDQTYEEYRERKERRYQLLRE